jgi:hypothetical protein
MDTHMMEQSLRVIDWRRWRVGRKVGRTIYLQVGDEPSDDDVLVGVMDTPELAALAVAAVNALADS